jgi:hypothetical protein
MVAFVIVKIDNTNEWTVSFYASRLPASATPQHHKDQIDAVGYQHGMAHVKRTHAQKKTKRNGKGKGVSLLDYNQQCAQGPDAHALHVSVAVQTLLPLRRCHRRLM